jgi:hypothetical protein
MTTLVNVMIAVGIEDLEGHADDSPGNQSPLAAVVAQSTQGGVLTGRSTPDAGHAQSRSHKHDDKRSAQVVAVRERPERQEV